MFTNRILSVLNALALLGMLAVNALANILPINNLNTGQVSDLYPSYFTPTGITFSIWGVIYSLLIGFVILQLFSVHQQSYFKRLAGWFLLSCLFNSSWIIAWHYLYPTVSLGIMLLLLFSLIKIFIHLNENPVTTLAEKALVRLPFTMYLAWICVATIANTAAVLVSMPEIQLPFEPAWWAIAMMMVATALALFITLKYQAPVFALVVIWALFGIFLRWQQTSFSIIATYAVVLMILLSSVYIYTSQKVLRKVF